MHLSLFSIRKQHLRSGAKLLETTYGGFVVHVPTYASRMNRHKKMVGVYVVELKLSPCTPPLPRQLLVLHLIPSASFMPCPVSASWFLSLDSPQTPACTIMTCFDLASLDWPWALGCSMRLIPSLGSHLLSHSKPMYFCSWFNPLWLLAATLSLALPGQLFTLGLTLMFS